MGLKWNETQVFLDFPLFRGPLILKRIPEYLRFVVVEVARVDRKWDALDQLDDEPQPEETIFAAKLVDRSKVHVDKRVNGKHVGEWFSTARYAFIKEDLPDDVLRSTDKWREWCMEQVKKEESKKCSEQ